MKKTLLVVAVVLVAQLLPHIASTASTPSNQIIGMSLTEGDSLQTSLSHITARTSNSRSGFGIICDGLDDPDCVGKDLNIRSFLLPCSDQATIACIKEVYAESEDGAKVVARFIRSVSTSARYDFKENLERGVVAGSGTGGLWEFPGLVHGGGNSTYGVQARLEGAVFPGNQTDSVYNQIEFGIAAVREVAGTYIQNTVEYWAGTPDDQIRGWNTIGANGRPDYKCVMTDVGRCYERSTFPPGYRLGMVVLVPKELSGWFHGRIYSPEITIMKVDRGYEYTIEARPVKVPFIREEIRSSSWSKELVDYVNANFTCNPEGDCSNTGGGLMMPGNSGPQSFDLTRLFLPVTKDKSSGTGDYWSIRTLQMFGEGVNPGLLQSCSTNASSVSGIVTTNSMVYSAGPPIYNPESSSLDYKVLSPHYNEKGEENFGSYDLLLDSKVARCIYKFTDAPIKAEIEIFGSDGSNRVATTVIGERNGWLFMSANGFTYSEPTVRIKLTQEPPKPEPTPTPTVSPTPTPSPETSPIAAVTPKPSKKSVTCVKGKTTKKFGGAKCPKGWKKKA